MPHPRLLPEFIRRNLIAKAEQVARIAKQRGDAQGASRAEKIAQDFRRARQ